MRAELRRILLSILVLLVAAHPHLSQGQVATGIYPFGSFDSKGVDTINIGNLNVHLDIPIFHKAGRGIPFSYDLTYDNSVWQTAGVLGSSAWQPVQNFGWTAQTVVMTGFLSYSQHSYVCDLPLPQHGTYDVYDTWVYHDPFGVSHSFAGHTEYDPKGCATETTGFSDTATDNSGLSLVVSSSNGNPGASQRVVTRNGKSMVVPTAPAAAGSSITDTNGNQVTVSPAGVYTDTLGTPAMTVTGTAPNDVNLTYPNASGGTASYVIKYTTYTVQTNFGCSGISEYSAASTSLISEIDRPDGSKYSFSYETTPGVGNGAVTGRLASITLPTGGSINYSYGGGCGAGINTDGTAGSLTRVTSDGSKTYTRATVNVNASSTTVQDEKGNQSLYQFSVGYETHRTIHQGAIGGPSLLDVFTCYNGTQPACDGAPMTLPINETISASSYNNGSQLWTQNNYDASGMLTSSKQGDGSSTWQTTTTTYNALEEPYSSTTTDVSGNVIASSTYGYDEVAPTGTSSIPQHIAVAGTRGNQTSAHVSTGSSTLNTTTTYYDTGAPLTVTTPNGTTQYSYDPTQTFATTNILPTPSSGVQLSTSASYDQQSGVPISVTGMNSGQTTQYTQYDSLLRLVSMTLPNGSQINYVYGGPLGPNQTEIVQTAGGSRIAEIGSLADAYGRPTRAAVYNGQASNPWYQTDSCLDSTGLVQFQSPRYQGNGFVTPEQCSGSGTSSVYDALGRVTSSSNADGTTTTQYFSRAVETTDVNGVQKITQYDLLGRVSVVCEISSSTMPQSGSPQSCGTDIAGSGFRTVYAYGPGNTTTTTQGAQTRTFQTDAAGRVVYTNEPERGVTTYSYTYNSTGLQLTRVRPQANQTNPAVTTTTTTQYDSLGRSVAVNYSDGITPVKTFIYDAPCCWPNTSSATNLKGKLAVMGAMTSSADHTGALFSYDSMGNVVNIWECAPSNCQTATQASRPLSFSYDLTSNLISVSDSASGTIAYGRSPAGEVTSVTNQTFTDPTSAPSLVSNVINGPNGPISYSLGNGLNAFRAYDGLGRLNGNWVCAGAPQFECEGGTQIYGSDGAMKGNRVNHIADTVLNQAFSYGYDEFNRLTSTSISSSGQQTFNYAYDRYGNRWQQNAAQGGPAPGYSFNPANNQIVGMQYDAAGNLIADGFHSYTFDAEGNILKVDGGATAQYVYDALNRRARIQTASATYEYLFDYAGRRISTWSPTTNTGVEGRIYWDGTQIAFRAINGPTYFDHQDWRGTERMRTNYAGAVAATYVSLSWGDGYTSNVSDQYGDQDNLHFAQLDHDAESSTEHAQFRQLSSTQGRWMSPDPYNGSYDPGNPQSFNRYSYVLNNPLAMTDPTGLCGDDPDARHGVRAQGCDPSDPGGEGGGGEGEPVQGQGTTVNVTANPIGCDPEYCISVSGYSPTPISPTQQGSYSGGAQNGGAPNNGQEPPPPCQAKILNATNNQFGTNYTNANVTNTFNYSTGAGPGQGTLNLNINGSTAGVSTGYYPVHWYTYAIGFGPTLHVVGGDVLDSPQTLQFGPNQGTFHIDSGFPYNPIGAFAHWLLNMTKAGGYPKC